VILALLAGKLAHSGAVIIVSFPLAEYP